MCGSIWLPTLAVKNIIQKWFLTNRTDRVIEGRETFLIITAGVVHHRMLPPACSLKALCWNKSGYAKPNIPCWYQMGPRNVPHSMVKAKKIWTEAKRGKTRLHHLKKKKKGITALWSSASATQTSLKLHARLSGVKPSVNHLYDVSSGLLSEVLCVG